MELINKIRRKRALAKREKLYRSNSLPWQMEGIHRDDKAYMDIPEVRSFVVLLNNPSKEEVEKLEKIVNYTRRKGIETLFIMYIDEEHRAEINYIPAQSPFFIIYDENINELGEVKGVYMMRLQSKVWDLVLLDFENQNIPLDYLMHIMHMKMVISQENDNIGYSDIQYSLPLGDTILDYLTKNLITDE